MVLDSVKDKITKEYSRQSQIKNKIQTKANAHTGTPTICPVGLDTDNWNAYHLHTLDWIHTKATPTLERLLFAYAGLIQTTGTLTICPAGLDTHQNKRPEPQPLERLPFAPLDWIHTKANAHTGTLTICTRWIDTDNWNAYYLHLLNWIQTKTNAHTGTLNICTCWIGYRQLERLPFALLDWIQTTGTLTICPVGLDTHQSKRPEPQPLERLPFARQ